MLNLVVIKEYDYDVSVFAGKELFACQTAVTDFNSILKTVGGPQENERARRLLDTITVVPDNVSARASELRVQGKVKTRTKVTTHK